MVEEVRISIENELYKIINSRMERYKQTRNRFSLQEGERQQAIIEEMRIFIQEAAEEHKISQQEIKQYLLELLQKDAENIEQAMETKKLLEQVEFETEHLNDDEQR